MQIQLRTRVFAALLISSALVVSPSASATQVIERVEASVNSLLVLLSDISNFRAHLKLRSQLDPLFAGTPIAAKGAQASDADIREFLIDEKLIVEAFPASDQDVEQEINSIQNNNRIDRDTLRRALKDQGFSFGQYFELIRVSISKRNLIERDIRTKVSVSEDDVKNFYYNKYAKNSSVPLNYHIQLISVSISNFKSSKDALEVAQRAASSIQGGDSFEEVSKRVSDHPTAQQGGDLGVLADDQISPVMKDVVKNLKIGQSSAVFGGPQAGAYMIVKLKDMQSGESEKLKKMENEIRAQLMTSEYQHQISLWMDRARSQAFVHRAGESGFAGMKVLPAE